MSGSGPQINVGRKPIAPPKKPAWQNKGRFRRFIDESERIGSGIFVSALYAGFICGFFWLAGNIFSSGTVGNFILPSLYKVGLAFSQGILEFALAPTLAATLAPWMLIGVPLGIFSYLLIYSLATGTFSDQFSQNGWGEFLQYQGIYFVLPIATFLLTFATGLLPLSTALWITGGITTVASSLNIVVVPWLPWLMGKLGNNQAPNADAPDEEVPAAGSLNPAEAAAPMPSQRFAPAPGNPPAYQPPPAQAQPDDPAPAQDARSANRL